MTKVSKVSKSSKFRISGRTLRGWIYAYLFLLPWLVGVFVLLIYPLVRSFIFSQSQVIFPPTGMVLNPVSWTNYINIFLLDTHFLYGLVEFAVQTVLQVPIIVSFSLIIAILLNGKIRAKGLFRAVFFLPVIIATGPVMNELISEGVATVPAVNTAAVGAALSFLPPMVANPIIGLFAQLIMVLWNSGVQILIFLAALQKLSPEQYEAAKIDGGSAWECFWKITMPAIMPMIFLNVVYTVVWLANSEQNPVINIIVSRMFAGPMAAGGMPGGYGHASAQAWVYSVVILLILGLCWALLHERKEKPKKEVKWLAKSNLPQRREVVQRVDLHKSATQTQIPETQEIPEKKEVDQ